MGDFFYIRWKSEKKRMWQRIESGLIEAKKQNLLKYKWIFRSVTKNEIEKDNLIVDKNNEIIELALKKNHTLENKYCKYIEKVEIERVYKVVKQETNKKDPKKDKYTY